MGKEGGLLVCAIAEVVHFHVQVEGVVYFVEKLLAICWNEREVVEGVEFVYRRWFGVGLSTVVLEPASDVGIEGVWHDIEEILENISGDNSKGLVTLTLSMLPTNA